MIKDLSKEQLEIVEYSDLYSIKETCKKFSLNEYQVSYLREKRKRINDQNKHSNNLFIKIPFNETIKNENEIKEEEISFVIDKTRIKMSLSDFKKVIFND